jgi:uncharacterized protein YhaN
MGMRQAKYDERADGAKENYLSALSTFEALSKDTETKRQSAHAKRQNKTQRAIAVLLPLVFALFGILSLLYGNATDNSTFPLVGILMLVGALGLAFVATTLLLRPGKKDQQNQEQISAAHLSMTKEMKKLEACQEERDAYTESIRAFLDEKGLGCAYGSLGQARKLLDEAKEAQENHRLAVKEFREKEAKEKDLQSELKDILCQKERLYKQIGLENDMSIKALDKIIAKKNQKRSGVMEESGKVNRRFGEISAILAKAKKMHEFDAIKQQYQQIRTRQKESSEDLARLLLAKRSLEMAINAWKKKSQPEVYAEASRLLSLMSAGKWTQVRLSLEGQIEVVDNVFTVRDPVHLSLGTCQQLYLSLRIAFLMCAENVGRNLAVMADDILVNFDEERSKGAVQALIELAKERQVIIFTCHENVAEVFSSAYRQTNIIEL